MQSEPFDRRSWLITACCFVVLILLAGGMSMYIATDPGLENAMMLTSVAYKIEKYYPDDVDWTRLTDAARQAMFARLDRYSQFYYRNNFDQLDEEQSGNYTGIGITVIPHDEGLYIMSVREDGPADKAGLLNGDIIIEVDSTKLNTVSITEAITLLRGEENSTVNLIVTRTAPVDTITVVVTRKKITFQHIPFAGYTADSSLYIRLLDFDAGAADDLTSALDSLLLKPDAAPTGIMLDLRGNPGGLFTEAYDIANLFLDEGQLIVGTDGRSAWESEQFYSTGTDVTGGIPLAILVDNGSASASEIVAGSLRQAGRAFLVGDTTFGKGLVQGFVRFPGGDGLKLTTSRYYFEGDLYLNELDSTLHDEGTGLVPDYLYELQDQDQFTRELENSMLLRDFATRFEDTIIAAYQSGPLDSVWINRFARFANEKDALPGSERTNSISYFKDIAQYDKQNTTVIRLADSLLKLSRQLDINRIYSHQNYILRRLTQIAYERKFGQYREYREVLLPLRGDIKFAESLLKERH